MKLIIDIPDEEYKTLSKMSEKEKVNELSYYEKIIANGIPYESKGDLISREALKKTLQNREECKECTDIDCISCFYDIIDNAPTVEPEITEKQAILFLINNGWLVNHDKELRERWDRPQGEWIFNGFCHSSTQYRCNKCGFLTLVKISPCPNCGAKMKGGA